MLHNRPEEFHVIGYEKLSQIVLTGLLKVPIDIFNGLAPAIEEHLSEQIDELSLVIFLEIVANY